MPARIPKLAHVVWVAGSPRMTDTYKENLAGFETLNPDIPVRIWERPPKSMPIALRRAYWGSPKTAQKADLLRMWVLHEHGGVYFDPDVWWRLPVKSLLNRKPWCVSSSATPRLNTVMASPAGHAFWRTAIDEALYTYAVSCKPELRRAEFGPVLLRRLAKMGHRLDVLPPWYFFPVYTQAGRREWKAADNAGREVLVNSISGRYKDGQEPYGVHFHGTCRSDTCARADTIFEHLGLDCEEHIHGAEVGVFKGTMSAYALAAWPNLQLLMVDPWEKPTPEYVRVNGAFGRALKRDPEAVMSQALENTKPWADRRSVMRRRSLEAVNLVADGSLDFVYVDADHSADAVRRDVLAWAPKVRPGGILAGHDYWMHRRFPECRVCDGVEDAAHRLDEPYRVEPTGTWWMRIRREQPVPYV